MYGDVYSWLLFMVYDVEEIVNKDKKWFVCVLCYVLFRIMKVYGDGYEDPDVIASHPQT